MKPLRTLLDQYTSYDLSTQPLMQLKVYIHSVFVTLATTYHKYATACNAQQTADYLSVLLTANCCKIVNEASSVLYC
jgi:hypothetical protein